MKSKNYIPFNRYKSNSYIQAAIYSSKWCKQFKSDCSVQAVRYTKSEIQCNK